MAETFHVVFGIRNGGAGFDGVAKGTKVKKGEALGQVELVSGKGGAATVFEGKVTKVEAENAKEAIEVAAALYGADSGTGAAAKAANLAFESV